eukprot:3805020-Pyramimonas_sp.AAC.1
MRPLCLHLQCLRHLRRHPKFPSGVRSSEGRVGTGQRACPKSASGKPCKLSRASYAGDAAPQGRPLGLLSAWLEAGPQCMIDKTNHKDRLFVKHCFPKETRKAARSRLYELGGAAVEALRGKERDPRLGE